MRLTALLTLALAAGSPAPATAPLKRKIELHTERIGILGLPLAESEKPVFRVAIDAEVGANGEGNGVLVLDLIGPPQHDEFGFVTMAAPARKLRLDCALKRVKTTTKVFTIRVGGPGSDKYEEVREDWLLFAVSGPKITSKLFLAVPADARWPQGRFLVQGREGRVRYALDLVLPPQPEPCHPGCFPAGTAVRIPGGTAAIDRIREGDAVITVGPDGRTATARVEAVFMTRNRLVEVRTAGGKLVTTVTQPFALDPGGHRPAGDLKVGDRVYRWSDGKREVVAVMGVTAAARQERVFNLVLGARRPSLPATSWSAASRRLVRSGRETFGFGGTGPPDLPGRGCLRGLGPV